MTALERRYRRLLLAYPRTYRSAHGDELIDLLLDTAHPARTLPEPREAAGLIVGGLALRAKSATQGSPWTDGLHLGLTGLMAANLAALLPYAQAVPVWTAVSALALLAVMRGLVVVALPLVLVTGAKAVAIAHGGQLFEATLLPVDPGFLTDKALYGDAGTVVVMTTYALTAFGLLALAIRGGARRTRSWWWPVTVPVAAWQGPAWLTEDSFYTPSLSKLALELTLLALAIWAGHQTRDPRWGVGAAVYLLVTSAAVGQHASELTQQHLAYWGLLVLMTAATALAPYGYRRRALR